MVLLLFAVFQEVFICVDSLKLPFENDAVIWKPSLDGKYIIGVDFSTSDVHLVKNRKYEGIIAKKGFAPEEIQGFVWDFYIRDNKLYIAQEHGRISVFDLENKKPLYSKFLKYAHYPAHIRVSKKGNILISTYEGEIRRNKVVQNELISLYNNEGRLIRRIFRPPQRYIRFDDPTFQHILPFEVIDGKIYIFGTLWEEMWVYSIKGKKLKYKKLKLKGFIPPEKWDERKMIHLSDEKRSQKIDEWLSKWTPLRHVYKASDSTIILKYCVGCSGSSIDSFYYPILSTKGDIIQDGLYSTEDLIGVTDNGLAYFETKDKKWIKIYRINLKGGKQ